MTRLALALTLLLAPLALGCGSSSSGAADAAVGGPIVDAADQHCMVNGALVTQHVGMCLVPGSDDGGAADGAAPSSDYGPTLYNSSGYDDDCKYQVSFTSTPVRRNTSVTFTVTVHTLDPAGATTGADIEPEVYLNAIHPAAGNPKTTEKSPGVYEVGPIVFDQPGLWTVRFHMFEECSDVPEDSPHGHIAFYIDVP